MTRTYETKLGNTGPSVFPIALGCMGMGAGSWYGDGDEAESIATIHEAISWVRAKATAHDVCIIPTLGARTRTQLADALSSLGVSLDAAEVAALEAAVPASQVAGTRYAAAAMARLDSEI